MYWMLEQSALNAMQEAMCNVTFTEEQITAFTKANANSDISRLVAIENGVLTIPITGVLTRNRSMFAMMFGGGNTTFTEIIDAVLFADEHDDVEKIALKISSPGGSVDGLFDAMDVIGAASKPVEATIVGQAASAAFGLASQADVIRASNDGDMVGSIGVAIDAIVFDEKISIASTNAPNKRPDLTTEKGKAIVRAELDDIADKFATRIAAGRSAATNKTVTLNDVNKDFGRGGILLADKALQAGMIDDIISTPNLSVVPKQTKTSAASKSTEAKTMDLEKLKADHLGIYQAVLAEGVKAGAEQENKRVKAHLKLAEASGNNKYAIECIGSGAEVDSEVYAEHMAATMNKNSSKDRKDDDPGLEEPPKDDKIKLSLEEQTVALMEQQAGITSEVKA